MTFSLSCQDVSTQICSELQLHHHLRLLLPDAHIRRSGVGAISSQNVTDPSLGQSDIRLYSKKVCRHCRQ